MNLKYILLLICFILGGCGDSNGTDTSIPDTSGPDVSTPKNTINIYASSDGHFGKAFMLSSAFSSDVSQTILAMGLESQPYEYRSTNGNSYKVIGVENDYNKISDLVINHSNSELKNNLYLGIIQVSSGALLTNEAFKQLDSIYIVPEGTSLLNASSRVVDGVISFAKKAKGNGVKNVKLVIWDSINENILLNSGAQIARLPANGVGYEFFSFDDMAKKIHALKTDEGLLSAAIYTGAISNSITSNDIFIENKSSFDKDKDSVVLIGSYTRNEINTSKTNQIEILKKLESLIDFEKYNLIFKGHPSEVSVNQWIQDNPDLSSASYFKSFPYEIWQVLGEGEHRYSYNDVSYSLFLPKVPSVIYSVFSTTLYGENPEKINTILGYNKITLNDEDYMLTDEVDGSSIEDFNEYTRWSSWTNNNQVPFKMTHDWINQK